MICVTGLMPTKRPSDSNKTWKPWCGPTLDAARAAEVTYGACQVLRKTAQMQDVLSKLDEN
jgi:hypothetical protein